MRKATKPISILITLILGFQFAFIAPVSANIGYLSDLQKSTSL